MSMIKITCGFRNDRDGRTSLQLRDDGAVRLENEALGKHRHFETRTDQEFFQSLVNLIPQYKSLNAMATRKGLAGEVFYEFELLVQADKPEVDFSIWQNDLKQYPPLKSLIMAARELVKKMSDGTVRL